MNIQKTKTLILSLLIGITLAGGITFAATLWHGTGWIADGEVISASKVRDNFDYLLSLYGDACTTHNLNKVRFVNETLQYCNGVAWAPLDVTVDDGTGCASANDNILGGRHTVGQCNAAGGVAVATTAGCLCQFGSRCAAGWTKQQNWSATVSRRCGLGKCACQTGGHTFRNKSTESCTYSQLVRGSFCHPSTRATCTASRTAIGCK